MIVSMCLQMKYMKCYSRVNPIRELLLQLQRRMHMPRSIP